MSNRFFGKSRYATKKTNSLEIAKCGACGFYKTCNSPKMAIYGKGKRGILIVGESPGKKEDEQGIPFIDSSSRLLQDTLKEFGIKVSRDCWFTNALICRPPKGRTPTSKEISYCQPNLSKLIKKLRPKVILTLGKAASQSVLSPYWKDGIDTMTRWSGWTIPLQPINCWVCPTYHPAYILREENQKKPIARNLFRKHMKKAVQKSIGRPWEEIPNWKKEIIVITDPKKAAKVLRRYTKKKKGGAVSFDYETNCLKPTYKNAAIFACSVCFSGDVTIAYPFTGEVVQATEELLHSPKWGKIASNLKFEEGWTLKQYGKGVTGWIHDTVLVAHQIDNRERIAGLKFQAFVLLGLPDYNTGIEEFLKEKDGKLNRIQYADLIELLIYNGLDSILAFKIAEIQRRKLKLPTLEKKLPKVFYT